MSIFPSEPVTKGKVTLNTTIGPIDIELWSKEAPKACRNFVQLCMEGYYNGCQFFRVVKDFIAQTGDPTNSGEGGESIYEEKYFEDEFHSRLRFSRRGIVACASFERNKNGSQFFFTLDKIPELNRKNTIFGKVTGDSIYNLLELNELEVDENDTPINPPKIISADVVWNPFDDIIPRDIVHHVQEEEEEEEKKEEKKPNIKAVKNLALLSFGDDAEEDEEIFSSTIFSKEKSMVPKRTVTKPVRKKKPEQKLEEEKINNESIDKPSNVDISESEPNEIKKQSNQSEHNIASDIKLNEDSLSWEEKMLEKKKEWKLAAKKIEKYEERKSRKDKTRQKSFRDDEEDFDDEEVVEERNEKKKKGLFAEEKPKNAKKRIKINEDEILKKFQLFEQSLKNPTGDNSWKSHKLLFPKEKETTE